MNGTVTGTINVYYQDGKIAMQARQGDRVNIVKGLITGDGLINRLERNSRMMIEGKLFHINLVYVKLDSEVPSPTPSTGIRGYVYRNHEKQFFEFYKGNIPDTRPIFGEYVKNNGGVIYTKHLQYWLYNELQSRVPEMTIAKFKKDFEYWLDDDLAFFNFAGSETRRVYPLGLNLKAKDPHAQQIICGGMTLQLLDDKPKWIRTLKKYCYPISCINAQDKNIEDYNSFDYPHLWYRPAIQYGHTVARQEPFSQFHGKGRMPIMANGTNVAWIYADLVRVLGKDEATPNQYTLDWGS